jgi:hypothetical protein
MGSSSGLAPGDECSPTISHAGVRGLWAGCALAGTIVRDSLGLASQILCGPGTMPRSERFGQSDAAELSDQLPRVLGGFFLGEVPGVWHQRIVDVGHPGRPKAVQVVVDLATLFLASQVQQRRPYRHLAVGFLVGYGVLRERPGTS